MTNPDSANKPTLEELLRLKRAERPQPGYWEQFDRELRRKQLAATIEPRPWWLGLSIWSRKLAPFGLPAGAAAALALAAVSYQTIGRGPVDEDIGEAAPALAANHPQSVATSVADGVSSLRVETDAATSRLVGLSDDEASVLVAAGALDSQPVDVVSGESVVDNVPQVSPAPVPDVALASLLPGVGLQRSDSARSAPEQSPSQRFIAENLEAVLQENSELAGMPVLSIASASSAPATEQPVVAAASAGQAAPQQELSPRNARLLALVKSVEDSEAALVSTNIAREQSNRLNDDILYASATRLGVGGDRLSISF